ncbi:GntR family transcriptional regulator [Halalkalibacillus sediminis]|uniref:GntR family transcriptional regulator n=1 Tax=Halalkalibacillus sediminis TaxID=2018042 RepID=A0A2I0QYD8_9BACI|nr:GntR family transcriptional regulator [Halalkalibacillus sediminis]PKR79343.1 GntR family transcriptional regulator [Halalkalibacillus sediminis]
MNIRFNNRDPVYVQVVQHFKQQMAQGFYEPGQTIPSRRELANQLKINPNTAQRAYKEMEEEGLITTERNQPSRITRDVKVIHQVKKELVLDAVEKFIESVDSINMPLEDALKVVRSEYEKGSKGGA